MIADVDIASLLPGPVEASKVLLNEERVAWYVEHLTQAGPVTVFSLPDGLLLVDGHHRVEAAQRLGHVTVKADVHRGTRKDALNFAVELATQQRGVSAQVAINAIKGRGGDVWKRS